VKMRQLASLVIISRLRVAVRAHCTQGCCAWLGRGISPPFQALCGDCRTMHQNARHPPPAINKEERTYLGKQIWANPAIIS